MVIKTDWNRNLIGSIDCYLVFESVFGSKYIGSGAITWKGDSFSINIVDPCSSQTYMPLDFSATTSFLLDYTICQSTSSELYFVFEDSLSAKSK